MSTPIRSLNSGGIADTVLGMIGASALFAMMLLTSADVVLRYAFDAPLQGAFELVELMLVVLIFSGLPLVSRNDKHVTADFIDRILSARGRRVIGVIAHSIFCAVLIGVSGLVWRTAGRLLEIGDTTQILRIKLAPFVYLMSVLIFVAGVVHLLKACRGETGESSADIV